MRKYVFLSLIIASMTTLSAMTQAKATELTILDGVAQIASPQDFEAFAEAVNGGQRSLDAVLTQDILLDDVIDDLPMVGYSADNGTMVTAGAYTGTFDGQCHTITYHKVAKNKIWGLFGSVSGTVRNLQVSGTITTDYQFMASIANTLDGGTLENCSSDVDIITTGGTGFHGGLARVTSSAGATISSCLYAGNLTGATATNSAAILCFAEAGTQIRNTIFCGNIDINNGNGASRIFNRGTEGICTNCYYRNQGTTTINSNVTALTDDDLTGGFACTILMDRQTEQPLWRQTIGVQPIPVLSNDGDIVYTYEDIYANADEPAALLAFANAIATAQRNDTANLEAQKSLEQDFEQTLLLLTTFTTPQALIAYCHDTLSPLKTALNNSAKAYLEYRTKTNQTKELLKNEDIQNPIRTELDEYLYEDILPNNIYPHGTAPYILSQRPYDEAVLQEEAAYIDLMLNKMRTYEQTPGTDVTALFRNTDFQQDFDHWEGTPGTDCGNAIAESRNQPIDIHQTINGVKEGFYELQVGGSFQPYPAYNLASTNYGAILYTNNLCNYFQANIEDMITADDAVDGENCFITPGARGTDHVIEDNQGNIIGYTPNSIIGCSNALQAGRYKNTILIRVTDGTLTIGIRQLNLNGTPGWLGFGNIKVIYHGDTEDAADAINNVLASQSARAKTILYNYQPSDGADYSCYPNFSQELKDQLKETLEAIGNTNSTEEKYSLVGKLSELFLQINDSKEAYITLMKQCVELKAVVNQLKEHLSSDETEQSQQFIDNLMAAYRDGSLSTDEARQDYLSQLPFMPEYIDGAWQIGSDLQWLAFSILANRNHLDDDAVLTQDILLDGVIDDLPMIGYAGDDDYIVNKGAYTGTFDGQYHTINYHKTSTGNIWSLFGGLSGTIRNLRVSGTITTSHLYMASIVNTLDGGTLENCVGEVDIITTAGTGFHGGLARATTTAGGRITDCVYAGNITGATATNSAAILCFSEKDVKISNCLVAGNIDINTANGNTYIITRNPSGATITNCYFLTGTKAKINSGTTAVTKEELTNGTVCEKLNMGSETKPWNQHEGLDYPIPFPIIVTAVLNPETEKTVNPSNTPHGIYNLHGIRQTGVPPQGLYIINGKKIMLKP